MIYEIARRLLPPSVRKAIPAKLKRGVDRQWLILDSLSRSKRQVTFVQIGAHDGVRWDLIRSFILRDHWRGLLVEPLPAYFDALQKNYAGQAGLSFERAAISDSDGAIPLYRIDTSKISMPEWVEGAASFSREILLRHKHLHANFEDHIVEETVPGLTLRSLLAKHRIDGATLFYIDTEGYDYHVVKQALQLPWRPEMLIYEHTFLTEAQRRELETELSARGYKMIVGQGDTMASLGSYERLKITDGLPFKFLKS